MTLGSLVIPRTSMTSGSLLLSSQLQHLEVPHGFIPLGAGLGTVFSGPGIHHGHSGGSAPLKIWYLSGMGPLTRIPVSPHPTPWGSQPLRFTSGLTEMGFLPGSCREVAEGGRLPLCAPLWRRGSCRVDSCKPAPREPSLAQSRCSEIRGDK